MKTILNCGWTILFVVATSGVMAQKMDDVRMKRDIELAENVLSTMIKQQLKARSFFPFEVKGTYQPGMGIVLSLPSESMAPGLFHVQWNEMEMDEGPARTYSFSVPDHEQVEVEIDADRLFDDIKVEMHKELDKEKIKEGKKDTMEKRQQVEIARLRGQHEALRAQQRALQEQQREMQKEIIVRRMDKPLHGLQQMDPEKSAKQDSLSRELNKAILAASKSFLADYGDIVSSQLSPQEKIVITNRSSEHRIWVGQGPSNRTFLSIESLKSDLSLLRQNKLSRDQFIAKIKVVNTERSDEVHQDLELLNSIFNRLYRPDLSATYFSNDNIYYERLKDYGAVFYMQVFSSYKTGKDTYAMKAQHLSGLSQEERDRKVKELYPLFEQELKENILEYGRTLKSLKNEEVLAFSVSNTLCKGCGIPSSLEISVKASVLKGYHEGKIDKNKALESVIVKKGALQ